MSASPGHGLLVRDPATPKNFAQGAQAHGRSGMKAPGCRNHSQGYSVIYSVVVGREQRHLMPWAVVEGFKLRGCMAIYCDLFGLRENQHQTMLGHQREHPETSSEMKRAKYTVITYLHAQSGCTATPRISTGRPCYTMYGIIDWLQAAQWASFADQGN